MPRSRPPGFLTTAFKAVAEAERITLSYFRRGAKITIKPDATPVTEADRKAEEAIKKILHRTYPDHAVFGEEFGWLGDPNSEYVWIVDPIDGTKSFIRKIPLWGNLLALVHRGEVVLGVSNVPHQNELLWAEKGKGAYLNRKRVQVSKISLPEEAMMSFGSLNAFRKSGLEPQLLSLLHSTHRQRAYGDLWQYHLVATGRTEAALETGIQSFDVAPFFCIIKEAGGEVSDLFGKPFTMQISSIVATNGKLHAAVLDSFR
jgi:histidinol-phosphatase